MKKLFGLRPLLLLILAFGLLLSLKATVKAAPLNMPDGTVFDPIYYADTYPDLKAAFGYNEKDLWSHYVTYGRKEGRVCTGSEETVGTVKVMKDKPLFDPTFMPLHIPM